MKRSPILAFLLVILLAVSAFAADSKIVMVEQHTVSGLVRHLPDRIVVKFDDTILSALDLTQLATGRTGIKALDQIAGQYDLASIRPQFPGARQLRYKGRKINLAGWHKIRSFGPVDIAALIRAFKSIPGVIDAQPIGVHAVQAVPNDPSFGDQWHLDQTNDHDIDAPEAWDIHTGNPSITVAVLDTGIRYYHKDLGGADAVESDLYQTGGNMWINTAEKNGVAGADDDGNGYVDDVIGWDFVDDAGSIFYPVWPGEDGDTPDNNPRDFNSHGTHVSGIIAAITNNGYGIASPAGGYGDGTLAAASNGVRVMAARIGYSADYFGLGTEVGLVQMDWAAEAFYYAADNGADIASCSWGSSDTGGLADAIDYFLAQGGIIFKAAGNDDNEVSDYMSARADIVSVAATGPNDVKAGFSSYGTWVDISAPGENILSLYHNHNDPGPDYYAQLSGTSMATPLVASVAALVWSQNNSLTGDQVKQILFDSADPIDAENPTYIGKLGAGRVNASKALDADANQPPNAVAEAAPTSGLAPLTVSFTGSNSSDNDGTITDYNWDFGDGNSSPAADPTHNYQAPGIYTAVLTVTDDGGATDTDQVTITATAAANTPPEATITQPADGRIFAPFATMNYAGSGTDAEDGGLPPSAFTWIAESIATGQTFVFAVGVDSGALSLGGTAGDYIIRLQVEDSQGSIDIDEIQITVGDEPPPNQPPSAVAQAAPTSGTAPLSVDFTGSNSSDSDGIITTYAWNFGDGQTSGLADPSHTYTSAGTYSAVLTVTDDDGAIDTDQVSITVSATANQSPQATITQPADGAAFTVGQTLVYAGTGSDPEDGNLPDSAFTWEAAFAGGPYRPLATGVSGGSIFLQVPPGTFALRLTVQDSGGLTAEDVITITVAP